MRRIVAIVCLALITLLLSPQVYGGGMSQETTKSRSASKKKPKKTKRAKNLPKHFLFQIFPELKPPLPKGTSLKLQNRIADEHNLPRIQNSEELEDMRSPKEFQEGELPYLVQAGERLGCFEINQQLAKKKFQTPTKNSKKKKEIVEDFRYLNPNAIDYIQTHLAKRYCSLSTKNGYKTFMISSLVRTQQYQTVLARKNPNAREAIGDKLENRSAHLTGYAFDVSAKLHTKQELIDLARLLLQDKKEGYLAEVIFEQHLNNFHVMVFPEPYIVSKQAP